MVELRKIDDKNIWDIIKLSVTSEQKHFVASNTNSLLEAYVTITAGRIAQPFGIYREETPVGFVMFGYGTDDGTPRAAVDNYLIWRFMIAEPYQRQGLGRAALKASLEYLQTLPCGPAESVWLSYEPENNVAKALYESLGFRENGERCGGELVSVRPLQEPVI